MADHSPSPEWLPPGWTVEVRVRRSGKKDRCYVDPSNELKFYSKPEVCRYLDKIQINRSKSQEKNKGTTKRFATNFVVEKAVPEGLPRGWIKEMRVRKKNNKLRKDPYYTDPVSGYVFRSLKDVHRYLKTGELGRHAFKPKDSSYTDEELAEDKLSSHAEAERQKLVANGTEIQTNGIQSSELADIAKDENIRVSTSTTDHTCPSEHASDQCNESIATESGVDLGEEAKCLEKVQEKCESSIDMDVSTSAHLAFAEKIPSENGVGRHEHIQLGLIKVKNKREPELPRRASKRLAGIDIGPSPELKPSRRVVAKRSGEAETSSGESFRKLDTPEESAREVERENKDTVKQELPIVLPLVSPHIPEEHAEQVKVDSKADKECLLISEEHGRQVETDNKLDPRSPHIPDENHGQVETENKSEAKSLSIPEERAGRVETDNDNKADTKRLPIQEGCAAQFDTNNDTSITNPGSSLNLCLTDLWNYPCIEFAVKTLTGSVPVVNEIKADMPPGSPLSMPLEDLWTDPCIEFAVKTLTGEIPVGDDLGIRDYFEHQQRVSSSRSQVAMPSNVSLENFHTTGFTSQQFGAGENPIYKQRDQVAPNLLYSGNGRLQNSSDSGFHQYAGGRNGECPRPAVI